MIHTRLELCDVIRSRPNTLSGQSDGHTSLAVQSYALFWKRPHVFSLIFHVPSYHRFAQCELIYLSDSGHQIFQLNVLSSRIPYLSSR